MMYPIKMIKKKEQVKRLEEEFKLLSQVSQTKL